MSILFSAFFADTYWHGIQVEHPKHTFWPENFSYTEISPTRLTGYRQTTDAWLAELAKRKGGSLATLDEPLSALWPDSTLPIPIENLKAGKLTAWTQPRWDWILSGRNPGRLFNQPWAELRNPYGIPEERTFHPLAPHPQSFAM